jgi:hypothetical protein
LLPSHKRVRSSRPRLRGFESVRSHVSFDLGVSQAKDRAPLRVHFRKSHLATTCSENRASHFTEPNRTRSRQIQTSWLTPASSENFTKPARTSKYGRARTRFNRSSRECQKPVSSSCPKKPFFHHSTSPKQKSPFVRSPTELLCHRAKSASSASKAHSVKSKPSRLWTPTPPREKFLDSITKPNTRGIRPRNPIFESL